MFSTKSTMFELGKQYFVFVGGVLAFWGGEVQHGAGDGGVLGEDFGQVLRRDWVGEGVGADLDS